MMVKVIGLTASCSLLITLMIFWQPIHIFAFGQNCQLYHNYLVSEIHDTYWDCAVFGAKDLKKENRFCKDYVFTKVWNKPFDLVPSQGKVVTAGNNLVACMHISSKNSVIVYPLISLSMLILVYTTKYL